MSSLNSILYSAQTLTNLKAQQKKDEALYTKRKDGASGPAGVKREESPKSLHAQREASGYYAELSESDPERASVQQYIDRLHETEGNALENMLGRKPRMDTIMAKMQAGQKLSPAELEHLKKTDPDLYTKAVQIGAERKAYEERLKNCRTKEDVQREKLNALSGVMIRVKGIQNDPHIPDDEKLKMIQHEGRRSQAFNEASAEYERSAEYAQKPTEAERNAADRAEQAARGEAAAPEASQAKDAQAKETQKTEAQKTDVQTARARPEAAAPQTDAADTPEIKLPGAGKGEAGRAEAADTPAKAQRADAKAQDAHEAYRRMMKRE